MLPIYLSELLHYQFCPRQFALIKLERVWEENLFTAEGRVLHEKVHSVGHEARGKVKVFRSLPLGHRGLGIEGIADVVEYHLKEDKSKVPFPIEYKRGRPNSNKADKVQLCGQALCLEDMHGCEVPEGAIFYGKIRRRHAVVFDDELRALTLEVIEACRRIVESGRTPKACYRTSKCRNCSLSDLCHPKIFNRNAMAWLEKQITNSLTSDDALS